MSFASSLLPSLHRIRAIPGKLGLRIHTVELVVGSWSGSHVGDGTETTTTTQLLEDSQPPKVKWASNEEIALGNLHRGTVFVGPLTPQFFTNGGGGTAISSFGTSISDMGTAYLRITGPHHPNGAMYRLKHVHQERATQILLEGEPVTEDVA